MSAHTKARTTNTLTEFRVIVPVRSAKRVRGVLDGLLPLLGARAWVGEMGRDDPDMGEFGMAHIIEEIEADDEDDDGKLYTFEEAFPDSTPGRRLRGLRTREGITQRELAAGLGIPLRHVSEMENGRRKIDRAMARRIEKTYHISHKVFLETV